MPREVAPKVNRHMLHLRWKGDAWIVAHFTVGISSAALATVVAANTKGNFLDTKQSIMMSAISAGLMWITTALNPGKKGTTSQAASRHIRKAIALFESDDTIDQKTLGIAEAEAEDMLDSAR
jgi:hypothetical protein